MPAPKGNKNAVGNKGGRPTLYKKEYANIARAMCELGATDIELADAFCVAGSTIADWKIRFVEFAEATKLGKVAADERVERSLYARANGYSFDSVKIFNANGEPLVVPYREHVPPDTTACIFWLKNRKPREWRDRIEQAHTGPDGGPVQLQAIPADPVQAAAAYQQMIQGPNGSGGS